MDDSSLLVIETMSNEEKKIRGELEAEIERDLEEEIKDGIYHLALRLHRLYRHRKPADQSAAGAGNKTISELNINIKMEGETKIEIKETKREARPRIYGRSVSSTAAAPSYQYTNWAKTLRSGTGVTVPTHKGNDGSYKAKVMNSSRDSQRTR